jgi:hypothetical protein
MAWRIFLILPSKSQVLKARMISVITPSHGSCPDYDLKAKVLDCPAELEAVARERNRRTSSSFADYAKLLYKDAGIVATVLDTALANNDPRLNLIPGRHLRLFQMDPPMQNLLSQSGSFRELCAGTRISWIEP